jgi:hypothetical protein
MHFTGEIETDAPGERAGLRVKVRCRLPWWIHIAVKVYPAWCLLKAPVVGIEKDKEIQRFVNWMVKHITVTIDDVAV